MKLMIVLLKEKKLKKNLLSCKPTFPSGLYGEGFYVVVLFVLLLGTEQSKYPLM